MILRPLLRLQLLPKLHSLLPTRALKTTIRINKHKFQITLDVHQFNKDELRVKARPEYVLIEGKHERKTVDGYVIREFHKKIKLPKGCDPENINSRLSDNGILTITAEREYCEENFPCETHIPISYAGPTEKDDEDSFLMVQGSFVCKEPCVSYKEVPEDKRYTIKATEEECCKNDKKKGT